MRQTARTAPRQLTEELAVKWSLIVAMSVVAASAAGCALPADEDEYEYGETASYEGDYGSVEVSVSEPETFDPSDKAASYDDYANEVEPRKTSVYFEVTIKNVSDEPFTLGLVGSAVNDAESGLTVGNAITDGEISGNEGGALEPGKSVTYKDGWTFGGDADDLEYELEFGALQGFGKEHTTYTFTG